MNEPKSPRASAPGPQSAPDPRLDRSNPDYDYDAWETKEIVRLLEEWQRGREQEAQNALANKRDEKDNGK
jgi:hypothetical protein